MSRPAARLTDMHVCPAVTGIVPHVGGPIVGPCAMRTLIAALPAARVTDLAVCVGPPDVIVLGSFTVLIEGLAAARLGDQCAHGGAIVVGCPTVLIGNSGGAGGPQGGTMSAAREAGAALTAMSCDRATASDMTKDPPPPDALETAWIEVEMRDESGTVVPHQRYRITLPNGTVREGWTDAKGLARLEGIPPGECEVTFPDLDGGAWSS